MEGVWGCACIFLEGQANRGAHRVHETYGVREEGTDLRQKRVVVSPLWGCYPVRQTICPQGVLCDGEGPTWDHQRVLAEDWEEAVGGYSHLNFCAAQRLHAAQREVVTERIQVTE